MKVVRKASANSNIYNGIILIVSLAIAYIVWAARATAFRDFRVMYEGSRLIWEGRSSEAYDAVNFHQISDSTLPASLGELDVFISPPTFAVFLKPFTWLSPTTAILAWTLLGIGALIYSSRILLLDHTNWVVALGLPLSVINLSLGQTGFFALALAASIHAMCVKDKRITAGLLAGLTILKPPLFLGLVIWWALDWKRWKVSIAVALTTGVLLIIPTITGGFQVWRDFFGAIETRSNLEQVTATQFTLPETIIRLFGHSTGTSYYALGIYIAIGFILMRAALQRWPEKTDVLSGAAVLISVFISPHILVYDSLILVVPFAVAVHNAVATKSRQAAVAILVISIPITSWPLEPLPTLNSRIALSTFAMITVSWIWVRSIDSPPVEAHTPKELETV